MNLSGDKELIDDLLKVMQAAGSDWTNTFRSLAKINIPAAPKADGEEAKEKETAELGEPTDEEKEALRMLLDQSIELEALRARLRPSIPRDRLRMLIGLAQTNPRMLMMAGITDAGVLLGEIEKYNKLDELKDLTEESKKEKDTKVWRQWLRKYQARLWKEIEDVSEQEEIMRIKSERLKVMNLNNPKYILRNYIAQKAIEMAEKGDYSEAQRVLKLLEDPYAQQGLRLR